MEVEWGGGGLVGSSFRPRLSVFCTVPFYLFSTAVFLFAARLLLLVARKQNDTRLRSSAGTRPLRHLQ